MTRVFSGIQPTGDVHLGNVLRAMVRWVDEQHRAESLYCVVDLHALTISQDLAELHRSSLRLAQILLAIGLDPEVCTLFVRSTSTSTPSSPGSCSAPPPTASSAA
ncbi:MAG: hypothetical protein R2702_01930 [Acidimicrobiales bacterium]